MSSEDEATAENASHIMNGSSHDLITLLRDVRLRVHEDVHAMIQLQSQQLEAIVDKTRRDILTELRHNHRPFSSEAIDLNSIIAKTEDTPRSKGDAHLAATPSLHHHYSKVTLKALDEEKNARQRKATKEWQQHVVTHFRSLADRDGNTCRHRLRRRLNLHPIHHELPDTAFTRFMHGPIVRGMTVTVVLLNVFWLALAAQSDLQRAMNDPNSDEGTFDLVVTAVFSCVYLLELVLRLSSDRLAFFFGPEWGWNLFDTLMAVSATTDIIVEVKFHHARILATYRWTKAFKVARLLKYFKGIRDVVSAMEHSVSVLSWSLVMIFLANLLVSIMFMQALKNHIERTGMVPDGTRELWGDIEKAMVTLFGCLTGGIDWLDAQKPMNGVGSGTRYLFYLWVAGMTIGMMSILVGLLSQKALASIKYDHHIATENQKDMMKKISMAAKKLFAEMDVDNSGIITWAHFRDHLTDENVKAFFLSQDLNVIDAVGLFHLIEELDLANDLDEAINLDSFTLGLMRLTGTAKSTDLIMLLHENRKQTEVLLDVVRTLTDLGSGYGISDAPEATVTNLSSEPADVRVWEMTTLQQSTSEGKFYL